MDCNPSAPSILKNTNMNIKGGKKQKRLNVTAGARADITAGTGFTGGDKRCDEVKLDSRGFEREFPPLQRSCSCC